MLKDTISNFHITYKKESVININKILGHFPRIIDYKGICIGHIIILFVLYYIVSQIITREVSIVKFIYIYIYIYIYIAPEPP